MDKWKDYKKKHMKQRGSDSYDKPEEEASRGFFNRGRDEDEEEKKRKAKMVKGFAGMSKAVDSDAERRAFEEEKKRKKKDGLSKLRNMFK